MDPFPIDIKILFIPFFKNFNCCLSIENFISGELIFLDIIKCFSIKEIPKVVEAKMYKHHWYDPRDQFDNLNSS